MPIINPLPLRIAHLSDLHFFSPTWNPRNLFSAGYRSCCAQLHALLNRSRRQIPQRTQQLGEKLNTLSPFDLIIVSGDLTTNGCEKECEQAISWIKQLPDSNLIVIPGNHDYFSFNPNSEWPFLKIMEHNMPQFDVSEFLTTSVCSISLPQFDWTIICVNLANPFIGHAQGIFSQQTEEILRNHLDHISTPCIVVAHFPPYPRLNPRTALLRSHALVQLLLRYPCVKMYLHGHTHQNHHQMTSKSNGSLLSLDSGTSLIGSRTTFGAYHLSKKRYQIDRFFYGEQAWSLEGSFFKNPFFSKTDNP